MRRVVSRLFISCFNSRPCVRGDIADTRLLSPAPFQFTPLREGRRPLGRRHACPDSFNSRPCVRGDQPHSLYSQRKSKFQFTPLREGRRQPLRFLARPFGGFNSHPCVRGDWKFEKFCYLRIQFQFTPLREGRPFSSVS